MSVDKFGRSIISGSPTSSDSSHLLSPYRHGFIFTSDGNIDVENLKLCNVKSPTESSDCVNKQYVDTNNENLLKKIDTVKNTIPIIVAKHSDLERKAFVDNVRDLESRINTAMNVIPDMINQKIYLDTQTYKRKYDDEIKKLQQKVDDVTKSINQQIDLDTKSYKTKYDEELKKIRKAIVSDATEVRAVLTQNISDLKNDINYELTNLKYDLKNLIKEKVVEQDGKIDKDLTSIENKLKDFQKTVQNRIDLLENRIVNFRLDTVENHTVN